MDRERQENAAAGVEIVEKEVEEESLAVGCQGRPGLSRELVTNVNRRWAHWSTTGEAAAAAAAADDAAAAAADGAAAADWSCCEFDARLALVGAFARPEVDQEEEVKVEYHPDPLPHHVHRPWP